MNEVFSNIDNDSDNSDFGETDDDILAAEPIIQNTKTDQEPVEVETASQSKTLLNTQAKRVSLTLRVPRFEIQFTKHMLNSNG